MAAGALTSSCRDRDRHNLHVRRAAYWARSDLVTASSVSAAADTLATLHPPLRDGPLGLSGAGRLATARVAATADCRVSSQREHSRPAQPVRQSMRFARSESHTSGFRSAGSTGVYASSARSPDRCRHTRLIGKFTRSINRTGKNGWVDGCAASNPDSNAD